jgi:glucokinase
MDIRWHLYYKHGHMERDETTDAEGVVFLACDVGGTNTSCALVEYRNRSFQILARYRYESQRLSTFDEALKDVMDDVTDSTSAHSPRAVCISGAGPIRNNVCHLTNVSWRIDGSRIADMLGIPVQVINDFTAISYGIPLLDTGDADSIACLPHPTGTIPVSDGVVRAVVGAGTGLGVGYVVDHHQEYYALASEGGHAAFAPYDDLSRELYEFVSRRERSVPGAEVFVSGRGIANILDFFHFSQRIPEESVLRDVTSNNTRDAALRVSEAAHRGDPAGDEIMAFFVRNYARVASAAALHFLPLGGLYLAGGIVTKNLDWFTREARFMRLFLENYRDNIQAILHRVPVYVVLDYEVSLYGAAYSAFLSTRKEPS